MAYKKLSIGLLILLISASIIYISLPSNEVQLKITKTATYIYVNLTGDLELAGIEHSYLYNGTKKLTTNNVSLFQQIDNDIINITRIAVFNQTYLIDRYSFNSSISKKEFFPLAHEIIIINGSGLKYVYQADHLDYSGGKVKNPKSPLHFGKNMEIAFDKPTSGTLSKISTGGKLVLNYNLNSNYEVKNIRLFDPFWLGDTTKTYLISPANDTWIYSLPVEFNITSTTTNSSNSINSTALFVWTLDEFRQFWDLTKLISWYNLDKDTNDYNGLNNATNIGSAIYTTKCKIGGCYLFDGSNSLNIKYNDSLALNNFTVMAWIKPTTLNIYNGFFGTRIGGDTTFGVKLNASGDLQGDIGNGTDWLSNSLIYKLGASVDNWYHIAYTIDSSGAKIYANGINVANITYTIAGTPILMNVVTNNFSIGKDTPTEFFIGYIDDVRIYNGTLSPTQIYNIYSINFINKTYSSPDCPNGMISYWRGEGNANDKLGINNGTVNGTTYTTGKIGQAFSFDGVNDRINLPSIFTVTNYPVATLMAWVYGTESQWHSIISQERVAGKYQIRLEQTDVANTMQFGIVESTVAWRGTITNTSTINTWHHIVGVSNGTTLLLYIDGVFTGSDIIDAGTGSNNAGNWVIGSEDGGTTQAFNGSIDEIAVLNRALTPAEITAFYNNGNGRDYCTVYEYNTTMSASLSDGSYVWNAWSDENDTLHGAWSDEYYLNVSACTYQNDKWDLLCSNNCILINNTSLNNNNMSITGTGTTILDANLTDIERIMIKGTDESNKCNVICRGGCFK